jgi:hypothetical protein
MMKKKRGQKDALLFIIHISFSSTHTKEMRSDQSISAHSCGRPTRDKGDQIHPISSDVFKVGLRG